MPPTLRPIVTLMLVLLLPAVSAAASAFLADGYVVRVWRTDDGLPQNMVTCSAQTHDGFLWFGTYSGLVRFDGERFQAIDPTNTPGLQDRRITRLFEDGQGTLWIGHESGMITRYRAGRFEASPLQDGNAEKKIIGLGSDEDGRLWAMHENGDFDALDGSKHIPSLLGRERAGVMSFSRGTAGNIWLSANGRAARLIDEQLSVASLPPPQTSNYVLCVTAANDGGAWIICDGRVRKWNNGAWTEDRGEYPWQVGGVACGLELRDGTLAIGTIQSGLCLMFRDGRPPVRLDRSNGLPQNWVRFLYEDREGSLWAGAGSSGLVSVHATALSVTRLPDETQGCSPLSVAAAPDGTLWVGTDGAGLYRHSAGHWRHYGSNQGLANWYVPSLAVGSDGDVWTSDFAWSGPYRLQDERFHPLPGIEEVTHPAYALLPLNGGEVLVGNRHGLRHWKDGHSTWLVRSPESAAPEVCAIARDRKGVIWCGFGSGGIARIDDGKVTRFQRADGLASDAIYSLCVDDDDTLWIGTADRGLSRFKNGRFANLGRAQGLVDHAICAILDDSHGYLWLSTHHGIQRIAKEELHRCADGVNRTFASRVYDLNDGLPVTEFTSGFRSVACKSPDGRLWFTSSAGLVNIDPLQITSNPIPPPVVIESMWRDGKAAKVTAGSVVDHLPPDHERLEFHFSGLSFVAPNKVLFKYRLDGIDRDWIDAGSKRIAFYSRLPSGTYRLRVIACNNDGLWNNTGASLAFTVAPFFWETWWFLGACGLTATAAVTLTVRHLTRRRMQRRVKELERQNAVERERARIAQDIHDDIGASLSRITMLSQATRGQLDQPEHNATVLSRIYNTAREITGALDEIVWAINPRHDTLASLADYMGTFAQEILAIADIRGRLDLPPDIPEWPLTAETRHNLFLAFKEALNNAIKHSGATEVRISLSLQPDVFVLTIEDNGHGFDPNGEHLKERSRPAGGNGLGNMETRLARIGGRCEISAVANAGTRVSFIINPSRPLAPARPGSPGPR